MFGSKARPTILVAALIATLAACAAPTYNSWRMEVRGFLGDYRRLSAEGGDGLARVHRSSGFAPTATSRFLVESPSIWRSSEAPLGEVTQDDLMRAGRELSQCMKQSIRRHFVLAHVPAPDVFRIRVALTEPASSWVVTDTLGQIVHRRVLRRSHALSPLPRAAIDLAARARVEVEVLDGESDRILLIGQSRPVLARTDESPAVAISREVLREKLAVIAERVARTLGHPDAGKAAPVEVTGGAGEK